jgi:KDO2-lipid IV(A) lauroyltransferase
MASERQAAVTHRLEMAAVRTLVAIVGRLPLELARRVGVALGRFAYWPLGIRRRVVLRQIHGAFPGLEATEVRRIARASYEHFGRSVVEVALLGRLEAGQIMTWFEGADDLTAFDDAVRAGNGIVAVTGHLGSWELTAAYFAARGHKIDVIARHMQNPLFDAYLTATRERYGVRVVYDDDAVRQIPRALRDGRVVALVSDQGVKGLASAFVQFFGRPAKTPRGAAVFAHRFESPAMFFAAVRRPSGKYWMHVRPIPIGRGGDREREIDATVAAYTRILESFVRRYPEQYFWLHRRWRRQPPDTPAELRDPVAVAAIAEQR